MKISFFSTQPYDRTFRARCRARPHDDFGTAPVSQDGAVATVHDAVCAFVNDVLGAETLEVLASGVTRVITLRSAGFNHVVLPPAKRL